MEISLQLEYIKNNKQNKKVYNVIETFVIFSIKTFFLSKNINY